MPLTGPALRGDVLPRRPRRDAGGLQGRLGRHRRLDRRRGRRRPVELPHPHRRHRSRDRGGPGRGAAPRDPRDRPARPGRGGVLGAPGRRARRRAPERRGAGPGHLGRGGGDGRRHPAHLLLARRPSHRGRRAVDEPVHRSRSSRSSTRSRAHRSSSSPTTRTSCPSPSRSCELVAKPTFVVDTAGIQEGFAALLEYDPGATAEENAEAHAGSRRRGCARAR